MMINQIRDETLFFILFYKIKRSTIKIANNIHLIVTTFKKQCKFKSCKILYIIHKEHVDDVEIRKYIHVKR